MSRAEEIVEELEEERREKLAWEQYRPTPCGKCGEDDHPKSRCPLYD